MKGGFLEWKRSVVREGKLSTKVREFQLRLKMESKESRKKEKQKTGELEKLRGEGFWRQHQKERGSGVTLLMEKLKNC